jgi:glutaredoxin
VTAASGDARLATPRVVTVYSQPGCHLCEQAMERLRELQGELAFEVRELYISGDERLERIYFERIPVIELDGREVCDYFLDEALLRERLESSQ